MLTGGGGFGSKPKALMCYICGREYGTASLQIHLKTCMKKWEIEEGKKPKKERRPMPQPPRQLVDVLNKISAGGTVNYAELDSYNDKANDEYNDSALIRCEYCNRTFLPERLGIHRKICTPEKPFKPLPPPSTGGKSNATSTSTSTSTSASINKSMAGVGGAKGAGNTGYGYREEEQPKASVMNRGAGLIRKTGAQAAAKDQYEEYNDDDYDNNYGASKPMQSRTQTMAKPSAQARGQGYGGGHSNMGGEVQDLQLVECDLCGRRFAADRIDRHQKACTRAKKGEAKHAKKVAMAEKKQAEVERFISKEAKYKKNNWREQHREFVENLKYNRKLKAVEDRGGDVRALGPPPKMSAVESNMVPCPYCNRKFNPQSAEKHINICKNVINKPKAVPGKQVPSRTSQTASYGAPASKAVPTKTTASKLGGTGSYGSYGGGYDDDYQQPSYNPNNYGAGMSQAMQTGYRASPKPMQKGGGFSTQYGSRGSSTTQSGGIQGIQGVQGMNISNRGGFGVKQTPLASNVGRTSMQEQGYNNYNQSNSKAGKSGYRY